MILSKKAAAATFILLTGSAITHAAPVEIVPDELRGAAQPQIAVAPSGRIHVAFGKGNAIYQATSPDSGQTFSPPVKVGELPKLALGMRRGPRIVALERAVVISAISLEDGNLHTWVSVNSGVTWKTGPVINDRPGAAREGLQAMAGDGKNNVLAVWLDDRNGGKELWRAISADGGASWSANALVYSSPDGHICECCHPSATMDGQGRAAMMWRNWLGGSRDMYTASSADAGKTFAAAQKLGSGTWKLDGCPMDGGAIALTAAGQPLTVWRRERTVFASAAGAAEEILAATGSQPIVVSGAGGTYEIWESDGALMQRKGDASPSRLAVDAQFASAAALPKKGAIVVWESRTGGSNTLFAESLDQ